MEWHIKCDPKEISRYIFCPGDQKRAKKIADQFDDSHLVTESRGYVVYSGEYKGVFMTVCGTGMGGPAVAIGVEELAHMGGDTFIRVGSCGVFQEGQKPGDVIAAAGTVRGREALAAVQGIEFRAPLATGPELQKAAAAVRDVTPSASAVSATVHPGPSGPVSHRSNARAYRNRFALVLPLRVKASSSLRSSGVNVTR
jgi:uridine phosphorylase